MKRIEVGAHRVQLPGGSVVAIDQIPTRDELVRLERALAQAGDPTGGRTHTVDLYPPVGEWARAVVHLHRTPVELDGSGEIISVAIEVTA